MKGNHLCTAKKTEFNSFFLGKNLTSDELTPQIIQDNIQPKPVLLENIHRKLHIPHKIIIENSKLIKTKYIQGFNGVMTKEFLENANLTVDSKFRVEIKNHTHYSSILLFHQKSKRLFRSIRVDFKQKKIKSSNYLGYLVQEDDRVIIVRLFLEFEGVITRSHYIITSLRSRTVTETTIFDEASTQDIPCLFNGIMSPNHGCLYLWDHKNTIQELIYNYKGKDFFLADTFNVPGLCNFQIIIFSKFTNVFKS